jgi:AmmeMemoRadiSam system protein A
LESFLSKRTLPKFEVKQPGLLEKKGAFVTLTKFDQLCGCIGMIQSPKQLWQTVVDCAVSSATQDPRFESLTFEELADVKIEISVLSPFTKLGEPKDIQVGKHGLYIKKGSSSGLLLPQVAERYNWDAMEFLRQVCRKAGMPEDTWKHKGAEIFVFTAEIFSEN